MVSQIVSASMPSSLFSTKLCCRSMVLWVTLLAMLCCVFARVPSADAAVLSEQQQATSDLDSNRLERESRAPKPKFIRFGRAGQKFIRFGRSGNSWDYGNDVDANLINGVELYPQFRPFMSTPKRAQKFIRFG